MSYANAVPFCKGDKIAKGWSSLNNSSHEAGSGSVIGKTFTLDNPIRLG
ncbi:MAG: hypothetical protein RM347_019830 [Nostoc sp. ChiQUE02]|nr:hypothetical protein [Nostoc sp. ChiQUE02]MDZ8229774.1 hypothetical protein [Nostoc sp. ChiQUE02]